MDGSSICSQKKVEEIIKSNFNSCLLNLYHNGSEGVDWHGDAEKTLGNRPVIASLSFGAKENFHLNIGKLNN